MIFKKLDKEVGREHIARLVDWVEEKRDLWLIYELCEGKNMNEGMFEVKGEFYKGERIYMVHHSQLYHDMRSNQALLADFIRRMAEVLYRFAIFGIVHADLKPDNILVKYDPGRQVIENLKVIDFGSAFLLSSTGSKQSIFASSTPEYLPYEIQFYLTTRFTQQLTINIADYANISYVFDVWSLGSIITEILSGFPLWLSLKSRVKSIDGKSIINYGLFGVSGRDNGKIMKKQEQLLRDGIGPLRTIIRKQFDAPQKGGVLDNEAFLELLQGMLEFNAPDRIAPRDIINHPFITAFRA